MPLALDHLIVFCGNGAPEAAALMRLGLQEAAPNTHPGQALIARGLLSFAHLDHWLMTICFDEGAQGASADLRPALPLALRW